MPFFLVIMLALGCASASDFEKSGVSQQQANEDRARCSNYATSNNWGYTGIIGRNRWISLYENCMVGEGYQAVR